MTRGVWKLAHGMAAFLCTARKQNRLTAFYTARIQIIRPVNRREWERSIVEQELEILQGSIESVVYQNYDNGYSVLRLNIGQKQAVTVVGTIPLPVVGERLMVTGKWSTHSNYGRQFEAEFLERLMPETASQIQAYLAGRVIKGAI